MKSKWTLDSVSIILLIGWWILIGLSFCSARAQTPEWYAANPDALNNALAQCRDPLGGLKQTPECKAVERGLYQLAETVGVAHLRQRQAVDEMAREQGWRANPDTLIQWIKMCHDIPPNLQNFAHCPEAKAVAASILKENGK